MSTTYTTSVFFGTFVGNRTALGRKLDRYIEKHGGTPAPTEVKGVEINFCGSDGYRHIVVVVREASLFSRLPGDVGPPRPLIHGNTEMMQHAILQLLELQVPFEDVLKDLPPIGWYFAETEWT